MFTNAQLSLDLVDPAPTWIEELLTRFGDDPTSNNPRQISEEAA